jgi:hypothetical protein
MKLPNLKQATICYFIVCVLAMLTMSVLAWHGYFTRQESIHDPLSFTFILGAAIVALITLFRGER